MKLYIVGRGYFPLPGKTELFLQRCWTLAELRNNRRWREMCIFAHFLHHLLADFSKVRRGYNRRRVTSRRCTPLGDPRGVPKLSSRAITKRTPTSKRYIQRFSERQPDFLEGSRVRILQIYENNEKSRNSCYQSRAKCRSGCCQAASKQYFSLLLLADRKSPMRMEFFNFELSDDAIVEAVSQADFFDLFVDTNCEQQPQQQQQQLAVPQPAVDYSNAFKDNSDRDTSSDIHDINMDEHCKVPSDLADYFLDPHWDLTHAMDTSSDNAFNLCHIPAQNAITNITPPSTFPAPSEEIVSEQNPPITFTIEPLPKFPEIDTPQELPIDKWKQLPIKSAKVSKKSAKNSGRKTASTPTTAAERTRQANNEACARYRKRRKARRQSLEAERDALLARNAELRTRLEEKRRALTLLQDSLIKAFISPSL